MSEGLLSNGCQSTNFSWVLRQRKGPTKAGTLTLRTYASRLRRATILFAFYRVKALTMYLLILDSLGNTELLLILAAALIFFGPRRLPQLGRQLGKSLAEFRRASDDFKRTWEREVNLDNFEKGLEPESSFLNNASERIRAAREAAARELNSVLESEPEAAAPTIAPVEAEFAEARNPKSSAEPPSTDQPKHEWL